MRCFKIFSIYMFTVVVQISLARERQKCRAVPNTSEWPSLEKWNLLNTTVEGNLIRTIPPAAACHEEFDNQTTFNSRQCNNIRVGWATQQFHQATPASPLWDIYTNYSCMPTANAKDPCTIGAYPNYVINATSVGHVQAGVKFARENNIRLVIHNTGHDYLGKSSGASSLSIWTHNFKDIKFDEGTGVMTIGSALQSKEVYTFLAERGRTLVAGECENVGFSGGFIQGGGRGPLTGVFGMGADQALSFTLVVANGDYITANATQNQDLFWALRGGGGTTWGVVISVAVQTVPDMIVSSMSITFSSQETEKFWAGYHTFHEDAITYAENGLFVSYMMSTGFFQGHPILAPGKTQDELNGLMAPMLARLNNIGVLYSIETEEYPNFLQMHLHQFTGTTGAGSRGVMGSRIIRKETVTANLTKILDTFRRGAESNGLTFNGYLTGNGSKGERTNNSVHPAWRDVAFYAIFTTTPLTGRETQSKRDDVIGTLGAFTEEVRELSPNGGSYLNEANVFDPNWKEDFWGPAYAQLLSTKQKWDPEGVFYGKSAVGSELWEEANGQLCRL